MRAAPRASVSLWRVSRSESTSELRPRPLKSASLAVRAFRAATMSGLRVPSTTRGRHCRSVPKVTLDTLLRLGFVL